MLLRRLGRSGRRLGLTLIVCTCFLLWRYYGFWVMTPRIFSFTTSSVAVDGYKFVPGSYDWSRAPEYHPVYDMQFPPSGPPSRFPKIQATDFAPSDDGVLARREMIKAKFVKSWDAYKARAWAKDELMPLSGKGKRSLSGWSAQIVDALDTLWIMDLKDDFRKAVQQVALIDWSRTSDWSINVFEVAIRYLGGLIAAYDLSGEAVLLAKAIELGDVLYAAFDTPNRMPVRWMSYGKAYRGRQVADLKMSGAAGGTLCVEFTRLSQITGDPKYYDATERVKKFFYSWQDKTLIPGLWPTTINWREQLMENPRFSLGAGMDSMYEYLPKMHALLGGLDPEYEEMTTKALNMLRQKNLFRPMTPNDENILMAGISIWKDGRNLIVPDMQHLACFAGGMYALAGRLFSRDDYIDTGARLTRGCVWAYDAFPTKIMPEKAQMVPCRNKDGPCKYDERAFKKNSDEDHPSPPGFLKIRDARYLLRPEAIESVFYMWRITGDQVWRDAAWGMWEAIVAETETERAFASIEDVSVKSGPKIDSMETFWMGETLKYFYLIFADTDLISLDEWVLNTEAHPIRRPTAA